MTRISMNPTNMSPINMNTARLTPRYNIYALVHKGLRAYLSQTLNQVGRADWPCAQSCTEVLAEVRDLAATCQAHLEHENRFLHRAMEARAPGSSRKGGGDHEDHEAAIADLLAACDRIASAPRDERESHGIALYTTLALFVAENFEHMAMEEAEHNAVLWQHYSDSEILAIEQELVAAIAPEKSLRFLRWMLGSTSPAERAAKLIEIRAHAPAPVFDAVLAAVKPMLTRIEWQTLQAALALPNDFAHCDPTELDAFRNLQQQEARSQAVA